MEKTEAAVIEKIPIVQERTGPTHYEPTTEEAKALDRAVNLKFDFLVALVLAINFIVRISDRVNIAVN